MSNSKNLNLIFMILFLCGSVVKAQETPLAAFHGFYQFPNKVGFVKIGSENNQLQAQQVWDGRTYTLTRTDDNHFESTQEGYQLEFLRDKQAITAIKILGRVTLTKVDFDPTRNVELPASEISRLTGTYRFERDESQTLVITAKGNGIELEQTWDGKRIFFSPKTPDFFISDDQTFPLSFVIENGQAVRLTAFVNDVWTKVP